MFVTSYTMPTSYKEFEDIVKSLSNESFGESTTQTQLELIGNAYSFLERDRHAILFGRDSVMTEKNISDLTMLIEISSIQLHQQYIKSGF